MNGSGDSGGLTPAETPTLVSETAADTGPIGRGDVEDLPAGGTLGRYVILSRLGAGGMGVVYAAFDPQLDRKLALKLLRRADAGGGRARERLLREARAMAKLSHPNVVTVHDVGIVENRVFLAMEFVEGDTLKAWLHDTQRELTEVIRVFRAAGEGLAAAHAAGLVHRDFKPDNVMIGLDGRARVMDFGLARATDGDRTAEALPEASGTARTLPVDAAAAQLTQAGAILGTPAYMAPEQHLGLPADARSDQFSFAVALWEAVHGERPFGGPSVAALAIAVTKGELRDPPAGKAAPAPLLRVLRRALSVEPDERFPGMRALLDELDGAVTGGRRKLAAVGAGLLVISMAASAYATRGEDVCTGAQDELVQVWSPGAASRLQEAFIATGAPFAPAAHASVTGRLDDFASSWTAQHEDACLATNVRKDQSAAVMDLRMGCLQRQREELRELVAVLVAADREVVTNAVSAAEALPDPHSCADVTALAAAVPPPDDPAVREQVDTLRGELAAATALGAAGKYEEALESVTAMTARVDATEYAPLVAEHRFRAGRLQRELGKYDLAIQNLEDAYFGAQGVGHGEIALSAALSLSHVVGVLQARPEVGETWARHAEAEVARAGDRDRDRADLLTQQGHMLDEAGDFKGALAKHEAALEHRLRQLPDDHVDVLSDRNNVANLLDLVGRHEEALEIMRGILATRVERLGADHPDVAKAHNNVATALQSLGRSAEAREHFERAIEIRRAVFGEDHPDVASALSNYAATLKEMGKYEEAHRYIGQAIQLRERLLGESHPDVGAAYINRGTIYDAERKFTAAAADYERALTILEGELGPDHHDVSVVHNNLGATLRNMGREEEGRQHLRRALELFEKNLGPDHMIVGAALNNLGNAELDAKHYGEAEAYFRRGVAVLVKAAGEHHPHVSYCATGLGKARMGLGDVEGAIVAYEQSLEAIEGQDLDPVDFAEPEIALARALWKAGHDRDRALELGKSAYDHFVAAGDRAGEWAEDARGWLERRGAAPE